MQSSRRVLLEVQVDAHENERPKEHSKYCRKDRHERVDVGQVRVTGRHDQADDKIDHADDGRKSGPYVLLRFLTVNPTSCSWWRFLGVAAMTS